MKFMSAIPDAAMNVADLYCKYADWDGHEEMAERLAKTLDPKLLTPEQKDVSPQVNAVITNLTSQVQQLSTQLEQVTNEQNQKMQLEQFKQQAQFEIEQLKAQNALQIEQIRQESSVHKATVQADYKKDDVEMYSLVELLKAGVVIPQDLQKAVQDNLKQDIETY